jgi:hypothetical protein
MEQIDQKCHFNPLHNKQKFTIYIFQVLKSSWGGVHLLSLATTVTMINANFSKLITVIPNQIGVSLNTQTGVPVTEIVADNVMHSDPLVVTTER